MLHLADTIHHCPAAGGHDIDFGGPGVQVVVVAASVERLIEIFADDYGSPPTTATIQYVYSRYCQVYIYR